MPTYRYQCDDGHTLEIICPISDMEKIEAGENLCRCLKPLHRDWRRGRHINFHADFYEHVSDDGEYISSAQRLVDVCLENGNTSMTR
jgi:hypothetical protein